MTTSHIRGNTVNYAIVIADEIQNMTAHEADSVITRIGKMCKVIFCGDLNQRDITKYNEKNIEAFLKVVQKMKSRFDFTYFTVDDVVRSGLVGSYLKEKYKLYPEGYQN